MVQSLQTSLRPQELSPAEQQGGWKKKYLTSVNRIALHLPIDQHIGKLQANVGEIFRNNMRNKAMNSLRSSLQMTTVKHS